MLIKFKLYVFADSYNKLYRYYSLDKVNNIAYLLAVSMLQQLHPVYQSSDWLLQMSSSLPSGNDSFVHERIRQFTFDYSYWSADPSDPRNCTQEKVLSPSFQFLKFCFYRLEHWLVGLGIARMDCVVSCTQSVTLLSPHRTVGFMHRRLDVHLLVVCCCVALAM